MNWHIRSVKEDDDTGNIQFVPLVIRDSDHSWKGILDKFLRGLGVKLILSCNFDIRTLPIYIPAFYSIAR